MSRTIDSWSRRLNGSIDIREIPRSEWPPDKAGQLISSRYIYTWEPPFQIGCHLPPGFQIHLECWQAVNGFRWFTVNERLEPLGVLIYKASLVGHRILFDRGSDEQSAPLSHDEARLYSQFARHTQEFLGPTIRLGGELSISRAARLDAGTGDVLPDDIGLNKYGEGQRWTLSQFKDEGLRAARETGIANPTADQIASYGFYQAAQQNPLNETDPKKIEGLIRLAFFTFSPAGARVDPAAVEYVASQVRPSLGDHLDDTTIEFNRYTENRGSNLVNRIVKRKDCRLSREEVRAALVELGWSSFKMLAQCVDTFFRAFQAVLPSPLSADEKRLFSRMYRGRPNLGNIPLVFLSERFDFLKPAIINVSVKPRSRRAVGTLLRMIWYYAEVVADRRAADRRYKQLGGSRQERGGVPVDEMFLDEYRNLRRGRRNSGRQLRLS